MAELNPRARSHVLIVDDHEVNCRLLAMAVEAGGGTSEIAEDGMAALALLQRSAFDLVFMDISMPLLDGIEATRRARANGCRAPVVAVTAHYSESEFAPLRESGFDGLIPKPFDLTKVIHWVQVCVRPRGEWGLPA